MMGVGASQLKPFTASQEKVRHAAQGEQPAILADIYEEEVNIAIWQRSLSANLMDTANKLLESNPGFQMSLTVTPDDAKSGIYHYLNKDEYSELIGDIAELVDMFCCLFELDRAGLRLTALDTAMCPRFHVDRVPGRLVTTYQGVATEWLPHQQVDRSKLGRGSQGLADNKSGLFQRETDVQQLDFGDVAILKGELWEGNEGAGLVHRSPALPDSEKRLLLTLDFSG
jgi:hypothetical protein